MLLAAVIIASGTHPAGGDNLAGTSVTLLPDGRWLVLGGEGPQGAQARAGLTEADGRTTTRLSSNMHQPRAWHTAAVLPDGTVLIVGGIGRGRHVVADVELFRPATRSFELITDSGVTPRASHTATLLTDGRVLIAGGVSDAGTIDPSAEVWTTAQRTSDRLQTSLVAGRRAHAATLLPDGRVWIDGGQDGLGRLVLPDEVFDPADDDFRSLRHAPVLPARMLWLGSPIRVPRTRKTMSRPTSPWRSGSPSR